jgi:hypothetical protein
MKTIVVHMSDDRSTTEAMHLASAMARSIGARVVLLHLVLANNPAMLGWGLTAPTAREEHQMDEYAAIAEDYGVHFCIQPMQYVTLTDALAQAVECLHADVLFAHIPQSSIALWNKFRLWSLRRQFHDCRLFSLDEEPETDTEVPVSAAAVWQR